MWTCRTDGASRASSCSCRWWLVAVLVGGGVTLAYVDAERATDDRAIEEVTTARKSP